MTLLIPEADGLADAVRRRLPRAAMICYERLGDQASDQTGERLGDQASDQASDHAAGQPAAGRLDEVTFYCLPYMGDNASISLIGRLPALTVVQSQSSGVDDVLAALPPQVTLCNGRGLGHEEGTAELAVTLILASVRQIPWFASQQARRTWSHVRTEILAGQRVLLIGYGAIGAAVEQRLVPFGVQVSRVSRTAREGVSGLAELPELAARADIAVVCIALAPETAGLVGAAVLAALPDGALVVNVARGPVIDAAALAAELRSGRLSAALDVADVEPLPASRPEWTLPNVLITPHIGGDTHDFARRAPAFVAEQAARHLAGQPLLNVVRPARPAPRA